MNKVSTNCSLNFPPHTINVIELNCKVVKKKWQPPPFSSLYPLSSKKLCTSPPRWLNFCKIPTPFPPDKEEGVQLCGQYFLVHKSKVTSKKSVIPWRYLSHIFWRSFQIQGQKGPENNLVHRLFTNQFCYHQTPFLGYLWNKVPLTHQ